jgi:cytochrome c-type biogenesis protein CcmH/NrfF
MTPARRTPVWFPWAVMGVIVVVALAVGTLTGSETVTPADRVLALTQSIRCPQCAGQSVAESDVSVAREIRREIAQRVEQGQTDDQIRAYFASAFGSDALLTPPSDGVGGLVWILPVVAVVVALGGLAVAFRRWSGDVPVPATDDDRALVDQALNDEVAGASPTTGQDAHGEPT